MIVAKDMREAYVKSRENPDKDIHFPGGALRFVAEIRSGDGKFRQLAEWRGK